MPAYPATIKAGPYFFGASLLFFEVREIRERLPLNDSL